MNSILISEIIIAPDRQRQEFEPEAMQELKVSIEDRGLLHPPVLRRTDDGWMLVAGERRIKAMGEIFELGGFFKYDTIIFAEGKIPFTDIGTLTHLEAEEAELDENLRRRDLTWQEHAAAVGKLHSLRSNQRTELINGMEDMDDASLPTPAQHSIADTAEELTGRRDGSYQDNIRKEIIVSKHLSNPVIAKAKNAEEAYKLLKKDEERTKNIELAAIVGASFNADIHQLYNANCLEWMSDPAHHGMFDVILTDPPYGMGADQFGDAGGKLTGIEHHYDDSYASWVKLMEGPAGWCALSYKVAKPQAHAYVFCDFDRFHELKVYMEAAGWYVFRTPFISCKINSGRVPLPDQGPRRQYEILLYAIKGKKPVTHIYGDVIQSTADENLKHGAQKPVSLYQNLLQRSVRPGDHVLDCFAGTGTIFPACHNYQCKAIGIEQAPEYYALAMQRLTDVKNSDTLGLDL